MKKVIDLHGLTHEESLVKVEEYLLLNSFDSRRAATSRPRRAAPPILERPPALRRDTRPGYVFLRVNGLRGSRRVAAQRGVKALVPAILKLAEREGPSSMRP